MAIEKRTPEQLLAEIEELRTKLGAAEAAKNEAQELASAMAEASAFGGKAEEQATGKTITQSVCINPWERDEKKHKFKDVKVPTYYYTIELPAGAGVDLSTNGVSYYHGQTYEVDHSTLQDLKSRVARCWDHEKSIHSENENAYRRPQNTHLKTAAAIQRGY